MKKFSKIYKSSNFWILILYLTSYVLILEKLRNGVGQYWDWNFPYYKNELPNFFNSASNSWTNLDLGQPLSYSSDYYFRFFISKIPFLQPESILYIILVLLFTFTSFVIYKTLSTNNDTLSKRIIMIMVGFVGILNPAVFYKLNAGHLNYLCGYLIFCLLLLHLMKFNKNRISSNIITAILIAMSAIQLQFLAFSYLLFGVYYLFYNRCVHKRSLALMVIIPILLNGFWLSNFIIGANNASDVSKQASEVSVAGSTSTEILNAFNFHFSDATQLSKLVGSAGLIFASTILIWIVTFLILEKEKSKKDIFLLINMLIYILLITGFYLSLNLSILKFISPMFREVGHFAPLILLFAYILSFSLLPPNKLIKISFGLFLILTIGVNATYFFQYKQNLNFSYIRKEFKPFKEFVDSKNSDRVLTYPFFDQYNFLSVNQYKYQNFPLSNTGHDSFMRYSGTDFINNSIAPKKFDASIQKRFLDTYDVSILSSYGIRYIFDMSHIYQSNYEKYVPSSVYGDTKFIKNDPLFFEKILEKNGNRVKKLSPNIIEILGSNSRITVQDKILKISNKDNSDDVGSFLNKLNITPFNYLYSAENTADVGSLFKSTDRSNYSANYNLGGESRNIYRTNKTLLSYKYENGILHLIPNSLSLFDGQKNLYTQNADEIIIDLRNNQGKYLLIDNKKIKIQSNNFIQLGVLDNPIVKIINEKNGVVYKTIVLSKDKNLMNVATVSGSNKFQLDNIAGPNVFESDGLKESIEQNGVSDCNKYDNNPAIEGSVSKYKKDYITLKSKRHDACVSLKSYNVGIPETSYTLQYSSNLLSGNKYGVHISFNDDESGSINRQIDQKSLGSRINTLTFKTPQKLDFIRVYFYAFEPKNTSESIVEYGDVRLSQTPDPSSLFYFLNPEFEGHKYKSNVVIKKNGVTNISFKIKQNSSNSYILFGENYNKLWSLNAAGSTIKNHILGNGYENAWFVDNEALCRNNNKCTKHSDGSYSYDVSIYYNAEKPFIILKVVSIVTFLILVAYLIRLKIVKKSFNV